MILTKEQLNHWREYAECHSNPLSQNDALSIFDTIDALTQTNAELTAKLDAVREVVKELDALSWSDTEGERLARSILSILDAPTKPKETRDE